MLRASNLPRVRFPEPNGLALASKEERETAWLSSKTEVCGSALAGGEEEMTSQKGVVTEPGRRPGPGVLGGAQRGSRSGRTDSPLPQPETRRGRPRKAPR